MNRAKLHRFIQYLFPHRENDLRKKKTDNYMTDDRLMHGITQVDFRILFSPYY